MATTSARLGLRKPADADNVDVDLDVNPLVQHIDDNVPSKAAALVAGSTGAVAALRTDTTGTLANNRAQAYRKQGEANDAHSIDFDGKLQWGPGGSTALDTNLYRAATDKLKTDDALDVAGLLSALANLSVGSNLSVAGSGALTGKLNVGGDLTVSGKVNETARAQGNWAAANSTQDISAGGYGGGSANDLLFGTAVTAAVGLTMSTATGASVITVGQTGWYHISAQFDIVIGGTGQVNLTIQKADNSISYGTHEAFFPGAAWTIGTAHALCFLTAGDQFKATLGVFLASGAATITDANAPGGSGPGVGRTHLRAVRIL